MSLMAVNLVLVCLLGWYVALKLLPVSRPGCYSLSLGLGGLFALVVTGLLTWFMLVVFGQALIWVPLIALVGLACAVTILSRVRALPARVRSRIPPGEDLTRTELLLIAVLLGLMAVRLLSLLPDVLLRPLFAWDAWTVWGYEARVWLEMARYVEFWPRSDWLIAPADVFIREGVIAYPRMVPALILWASAGAETWTGVGPGLLWFAGAVLIALVIYGALRQRGLRMPWAVAGAYMFLSVPLVSAHVALYGYADLWIAAVLAVFAGAIVLADLTGQRFWYRLSLLSLLPLPLIKDEGLYWLLCGAAALVAARLRLSLRVLFTISLAGLAVVWLAYLIGLDLVFWLTLGRLGLSFNGLGAAWAGSAAHAFVWFDWHLFGYLAVLALLASLLRPQIAASFPVLAAFCLFSLVLLWAVVPLTGAGAYLTVGTLFSRLLLHAAPALVFLVVLVAHRFTESQAAEWRSAPDEGSSEIPPAVETDAR